jgi:hypothetical protein
MNDYDAIKETVSHYYEGYLEKNRERLEKAFSGNRDRFNYFDCACAGYKFVRS